LYHWGAIVVTPRYTDPSVYAAGGNPYGSRPPLFQQPGNEQILAAAAYQGAWPHGRPFVGSQPAEPESISTQSSGACPDEPTVSSHGEHQFHTRRVDIPTAGSYLLDPTVLGSISAPAHVRAGRCAPARLKIASGQIVSTPSSEGLRDGRRGRGRLRHGNARRDGDVHSAKFLHTGGAPGIHLPGGENSPDGGAGRLTGDLTVKA